MFFGKVSHSDLEVSHFHVLVYPGLLLRPRRVFLVRLLRVMHQYPETFLAGDRRCFACGAASFDQRLARGIAKAVKNAVIG